MSAGTTRRRFLRTTGAGVAVGVPALARETHAASTTGGKLVFTYDDGYREDYTQTFPVHREFDAPASAAIPSSVVGESEEFLTQAHLEEMTTAGWEVMSHTVEHRALGPVEVTRPVAPEDDRVYVTSGVLGRTPGEVEILDGDQRAVRRIDGNGTDERGAYLTFTEPVGASFDADGTRVRFTEEVIRSELADSKAALRARGFEVTNLVFPYGRYDRRTLDIVPEYYDAVANVERGGLNRAYSIDPYRLSRAYFRHGVMTESDLAGFMDEVANWEVLGILGGHSRHPKLTADRIRTALRFAEERNVEVVTLREGLSAFGAVETPTPTPTPERTPTIAPDATATPSSAAAPSPTPNSGGQSPLGRFFAWLRAVLRGLLG